jgi:hypothetical protein
MSASWEEWLAARLSVTFALLQLLLAHHLHEAVAGLAAASSKNENRQPGLLRSRIPAMASPFVGSVASSPLRRHAIIFNSAPPPPNSDPDSDGATKPAATASGAPTRTSPTPEFIGSVSLGAWHSPLPPSFGSGAHAANWPPPFASDFNDHSAFPAGAVSQLNASQSKFESMYMMRASQSKLFAAGKGGVGLVFADENSQLVVRGIVPGGTNPPPFTDH